MRRHRFDPLSFAFGVVFVLVAVAGLTGPWPLQRLDLAWVGPGLLILLGLVVLLTAVGSGSRADEPTASGAARAGAPGTEGPGAADGDGPEDGPPPTERDGGGA